jgi:hypothetical protein
VTTTIATRPLSTNTDYQDHPLIDAKHATLPEKYQAAKSAIAICDRIDECQNWADKAAALASYARQANDDELVRLATRIQVRAVRRCGELLKTIAPDDKGGGDHRKNSLTVTRGQAAKDAGLSVHQKRTALRVASIPEEEFELTVESTTPTITAMAERGTRKAPVVEIDLLEGRDPADFQAATAVRAWLIPLAEVIASVSPEAVARGSRPLELPSFLRHVSTLRTWLSNLETAIDKEFRDVKPAGTTR